MRAMRWLLPLLWLALLCACATGGDKRNALQDRQDMYSKAIRWGEFEAAWSAVDPAYRSSHPKTRLEFERYNQVQVSGYSDISSEMSADGMQASREIQVGVINKHTMTERSIRYTEAWRFDPAAKQWWITSGLPDFWAGE